MRIATAICGLMLSIGLLSTAAADDLTVDTAPPVVVKTTPEAGAKGVDPGLATITVTFNKDMTDRSWSWAMQSTASFPKTTGEPSFAADKRTAQLPVKLEAGRAYTVWINSAKQTNFKDAAGRPAVPYLLVFETR